MYSAPDLKRYFLEELTYLREQSVEFGAAFPEIARELTLNADRAPDMQVELLLQSFAYLTGRLRHQMDFDSANLPNQLLESVCPHVALSWPAAAVAQFDMPDKPQTLRRGTALATLEGAPGTDPACDFRTCYTADAMPVEVVRSAVVPLNNVPRLDAHPHQHVIKSAVRLDLRCKPPHTAASLALGQLAFFLNGYQGFDLHRLLSSHLRGICVSGAGRETDQMLDPEMLEFRGFRADEAMLPEAQNANPGLVLLREFFLFPEKFLFATLRGIAPATLGTAFHVYFLFDAPCPTIPDTSFQLNCAPIVNLSERHIDAITIRANQQEYLVGADQFQADALEIHHLIELSQVGADGTVRALANFYSASEGESGWWIQRRITSGLPQRPGTDMYLRFHDDELRGPLPAGTRIIGKAWCNNRTAPSRLTANTRLRFTAPAKVTGARLLGRPSAHHTPDLPSGDSRRILAQLNPNYLGLSGGQTGLQVLKDLLTLQASSKNRTASRRVQDGLVDLTARQIARRLPGKPWEGLIRGIEVCLRIKPAQFEHTSIPLFGRVLQHCLESFVSLNGFLSLQLHDETDQPLYERVGDGGGQWLL